MPVGLTREKNKSDILATLRSLKLTRQELQEFTGLEENEITECIRLLSNEGLITHTSISHPKDGSFEVRYHAI
ncbi:MAG: hypothetical protein ABH889_02405 [Candidatus Portnoybacteria bacterium]